MLDMDSARKKEEINMSLAKEQKYDIQEEKDGEHKVTNYSQKEKLLRTQEKHKLKKRITSGEFNQSLPTQPRIGTYNTFITCVSGLIIIGWIYVSTPVK